MSAAASCPTIERVTRPLCFCRRRHRRRRVNKALRGYRRRLLPLPPLPPLPTSRARRPKEKGAAIEDGPPAVIRPRFEPSRSERESEAAPQRVASHVMSGVACLLASSIGRVDRAWSGGRDERASVGGSRKRKEISRFRADIKSSEERIWHPFDWIWRRRRRLEVHPRGAGGAEGGGRKGDGGRERRRRRR